MSFKTAVFSLFSFSFVLPSYSQNIRPKLLLAFNSEQVTHYLDSLNRLKSNPFYKVDKDLSADGDLILKSEFSHGDEAFYGCISLSTRFQRFQGEDICVQEMIFAHTEYLIPLLNKIKDTYTKVDIDKWEFYPIALPQAKIVVTYSQPEQNSEYSYILYQLTDR